MDHKKLMWITRAAGHNEKLKKKMIVWLLMSRHHWWVVVVIEGKDVENGIRAMLCSHGPQ